MPCRWNSYEVRAKPMVRALPQEFLGQGRTKGLARETFLKLNRRGIASASHQAAKPEEGPLWTFGQPLHAIANALQRSNALLHPVYMPAPPEQSLADDARLTATNPTPETRMISG